MCVLSRHSASKMDLQSQYEGIIQQLQQNYTSEQLSQLRKLAINQGVPHKLRSLCWKLFLQLPEIDVDQYVQLVHRGPCEFADKIQKDTHRTFTNNLLFTEQVNESSLIRVLNATIWFRECRYVQGMNVIAGVLLYVLDEPEAFFALQSVINRTSSYLKPGIAGTSNGCKIVDKLLFRLDPELSNKFKQQKLSANLFAFPEIMTFQASKPPLDKVLRYWDAFLGGGFGLNILVVVFALIRNRELLLLTENVNETLKMEEEHVDVEGLFEVLKEKCKDLTEDEIEEIEKHFA
ncbi:Rab-GTPase-TBC_domain-containing protein [Hexamita inflata]|uniref:Rab-GTPase-TBC domain-containing protein n=1 Tax=Hexamita inflata TaxID=28002 RepID=A0AA86QP19_9EUKA|nr:Rab-GTPase-TBC domain-containing protein [Hexamita inflata]